MEEVCELVLRVAAAVVTIYIVNYSCFCACVMMLDNVMVLNSIIVVN